MRQIRQGVWETNSSSTHTLSLFHTHPVDIPRWSYIKIDSDYVSEHNLYTYDSINTGSLKKLIFLIEVVNNMNGGEQEYLDALKEVVFNEFGTQIEIDYDEILEDDNDSTTDILYQFIYSTTNKTGLNLANFKEMARIVLTDDTIVLESSNVEN